MAAESNIEGRPSNGADPLPKLAFLGPIGTYSHQAAYERFGDSVDYTARRTIAGVPLILVSEVRMDPRAAVDHGADAFRSVDESFPLALLPQENSIFGSVIETYDLLRDPSLGHTVWIRGDVVLPVQHSLVARSGTRISDIRRVLSHEQALGQCVRFLDAHLPGVKKESVPSTAGAAERLSKDEDMRDAAAICSKFCTKLFPGLEVLHEGIQNESHNFTRFYVLSNHRTAVLPGSVESDNRRYALLRLYLQSSTTNGRVDGISSSGKKAVDIASLLSSLRLPVERVDRRPSLDPGDGQFNSVYLVEATSDVTRHDPAVEGNTDQEYVARSWSEELQDALLRIDETGGSGEVIGLW